MDHSLFFTAPDTEASFFSLPYVEQLLWCAAWVDHRQPPFPPLGGEGDSGAASGSVNGAHADAAGGRANAGGGRNSSPPASGASSSSRRGSHQSFLLRYSHIEEDYTIDDKQLLSLYTAAGDCSGPEVVDIVRERLGIERYYEEHYVHNSLALANQAKNITARYLLKRREEELNKSRSQSTLDADGPPSRGLTPSGRGAKGSPTGGKKGAGGADGGKGGAASASAEDSDAPLALDLSTKGGLNAMMDLQPQRGPQLPLRSVEPSTLLLLRTGIARALGFSMPPQDVPEDDLCLGRSRCPRDLVAKATPQCGSSSASFAGEGNAHRRSVGRSSGVSSHLQERGDSTPTRRARRRSPPSSESHSQSFDPQGAGKDGGSTRLPSPLRGGTGHSLEYSHRGGAHHQPFVVESCKQLAAADGHHPDIDGPPPKLTLETKLFYARESGEALRQSALLEWFETLLQFSRRNDFTVVQTRALLLLGRSVLECLYAFHAADGYRSTWHENGFPSSSSAAGGVCGSRSARCPSTSSSSSLPQRGGLHAAPPSSSSSGVGVPKRMAAVGWTREELEAQAEAEQSELAAAEEQVEQAVSSLLSRLMKGAVCSQTVPVVERHIRLEPVTVEQPNPEALAALEHKMKKDKGNKKQQQQPGLPELMAHIPMVTTTTIQENEYESVKELPFAPCFSVSEMALVLEYLSTSALQHWRLFCCVLHNEEPGSEVREIQVVVDSTCRSHIPSLTSFLPANFYTRQEIRHGIWTEAEAELHALYEAFYLAPLRETAAEEYKERKELLEEKQALDAENRSMAFTVEEFDRVQSAFELRLAHQLQNNPAVGVLTGQEMFLKEAEAMAEMMAEESANHTASGIVSAAAAAGKRGGAAPPSSAAPKKPGSKAGHHRVTADQLEGRTDAVFQIEEVEERVEEIDSTVREREASAMAGKKGGKEKGGGGKGKGKK